MYNWNFALLVLLCVFNTIKADLSLVDGRESSRERSLRSLSNIRSFADQNVRLRKGTPDITTRDDYHDITILQENRRDSSIRNQAYARFEQSRNVNRVLTRFQTNQDRIRFRQREAEKNHYSRLVRAERLRDFNERRTHHNLNNLHIRADIRRMDAYERKPSFNRFQGMRSENGREVLRESSNSINILRSTEDQRVRRVSRISLDVENRDRIRLFRSAIDNGRKTNMRRITTGPRDMRRINEDRISGEQGRRERIAPFVTSQNDRRVSRQDIRSVRSIKRDNQRTILSQTEKNVVRRARETRNENTNDNRIRVNTQSSSRVSDLSLRSSERIRFANNGPSRLEFAMERDEATRRHINERHNERTIRQNEKRSSNKMQGILRSRERNVRDNKIKNLESDARDASKIQVRQRSMNIMRGNSGFRQYSNDRNVVRQDARLTQLFNVRNNADGRNFRVGNNIRSSLTEQRNMHTRESDRTRGNIDRNARERERNAEFRIRSVNRRDNSRSAEKLHESIDRRMETHSLRNNNDRTSERRYQRTGNTYSISRTSFDERRSNSRVNNYRGNRLRENGNRRLTIDNGNRRLAQLDSSRRVKESLLIQQNENVEKNIIREYGLNFEQSRNLMNNKGTDENMYNLQAAFYALQAIYICSIVLKIWNKTDSTKNTYWSFPWFSVRVNKID